MSTWGWVMESTWTQPGSNLSSAPREFCDFVHLALLSLRFLFSSFFFSFFPSFFSFFNSVSSKSEDSHTSQNRMFWGLDIPLSKHPPSSDSRKSANNHSYGHC